jgi:hypothetical protein
VVEEGTYDELLELGGLFHTLAARSEEAKKQDRETFRRLASKTDIPADAAPPMVTKKQSSAAGRPVSGGLGSIFAKKKPAASASAEPPTSSTQVVDVVIADGVPADAEEPAPERKGAASRLFAMQKPDKWVLVLGAFCAIGTFPAVIGMYFVMVDILAVMFEPDPGQMRIEARKWAGILFGIGGFIVVAATGDTVCFNTAGARLTRLVRLRSLQALLRQEVRGDGRILPPYAYTAAQPSDRELDTTFCLSQRLASSTWTATRRVPSPPSLVSRLRRRTVFRARSCSSCAERA